MNRKVAAIWMSLMMMFGLVVILVEVATVIKGSTIIYVDDEPGEGSGNPAENFTNIQDAINASNDGDTVFVYNGTYYENIIVNRTINLMGENMSTTIIDGGGNGDVIRVVVDWVNVTGFTVIKSGTTANPDFDAGIDLNSVQNCKIYNNDAFDNLCGIYINNSDMNDIIGNNASNNALGIHLFGSDGNNITGNIASNNSNGIKLRNSYENTLKDNNINSNKGHGIELSYSIGTRIMNNTMIGNGIHIFGTPRKYWNTHDIDTSNTINGKPVHFWKNQTGGAVPTGAGQVILANCNNVTVENQELNNSSIGILLGFSSNNIIINNNVSSNSHYGIYLSFSGFNNITSNNISSINRFGICISGGDGNVINGNTISSNNITGVLISFCDGNKIIRNSISSNNKRGINLHSSNGNFISRNMLSTNNETGIYLFQSDGNNITENNASNNFNGIYVEDSTDNNITNNDFSWSNYYGIHLYDSRKNDIIGNNVSNGKGMYLIDTDENNVIGCNASYSEGIYLYNSNNNNIANNKASSCVENGIYLYHSSNNDIIGNSASYNKFGIHLQNSVGNYLSSNTMVEDGIFIDGFLLIHWNTHNIDPLNTVNEKPVYYWKNKIAGEVPAGAGQVILANCTNITIDNQDLTYGSVGIDLGYSSNNNIIYNNASLNKNTGIRLTHSNGNIIKGNNASLNSLAGILLFFSHNNVIIYNTVNTNDNGIDLLDSNENIVVNNTFSSNANGVNLDSFCYNNLIYHNNIINNNLKQANDGTNNGNQWDSGYPSGGNYWSDYNGVDNFKGPDQDIFGGDGIGDTNYSIDTDSVDNYPLMYPHHGYSILKQGWNLISIPLIQEEQNLTRVLGSIDGWYNAVQWYDFSDKNDPWKHHKVGKPYGNDLFELNETMGFWVHITRAGDTIFIHNGTQPSENQTITLHPGWNMVGYPSLSNKNMSEALNNITFGNEVDSIWTYDTAAKKWEEIGPSDFFEIGRGHYIHTKTKCEWEVPL
jgi:parallel beta-helix repeat protein